MKTKINKIKLQYPKTILINYDDNNVMEVSVVYKLGKIYNSTDLIRPGSGQVMIDTDENDETLEIFIDDFNIGKCRSIAKEYATEHHLFFPDLSILSLIS